LFSKEEEYKGGLAENMSTRFNTLSTQDESDHSSSGLVQWLDSRLKRGSDILVACIGLLLLSPLFAAISFLIKRDSPGPVFYRGKRLGFKGKIFSILKFRTMYECSTSYDGPRLTAQDDPRITPLGRLLRVTKLNELPQLWNVLIGEMSLVGPRPEDPELAKTWSKEVQEELLSVRPGITSPASVLFRDEESMLHSGQLMENYLGSIMPSKLRLDQLYVRNHSFLLDLDTLLWTFLILLPRIGAAVPHEDHIFWGPLTRLVRRHFRWFAVDTSVTLVAIGLTGFFFRSIGPLRVGWSKAIVIALVFALLYSLSSGFFGLNRVIWSKADFEDVFEMAPALCLGTVAALALNTLWVKPPLLPPELILVSSFVAAVGFVIVRYRSRLISSMMLRWVRLSGTASRAQEHVLIIGGGESGQFLAWWMQSNPIGKTFRLVGFIDDDLYKLGSRIHGVEVLGRCEDIPHLVAKKDVGIILFAIHNISETDRLQLLKICSSTSAQVVTIPDVIGNLRSISKDQSTRGGRGDGKRWALRPADKITPTISGSELVYSWLDELSDVAQGGDLQTVQSRINDLRCRLESFKDH
jgi:lipopolysaccharide/colanic/teichoic acid biosynthesis glycosyltransferase